MFTKRSVLVGVIVLALARLVNGGVSSPPPPPTDGYLVEDLQSELFRLGVEPAQQVTEMITNAGALDTGFAFRAVDYTTTALDGRLAGLVIVDLVSADWTLGPGTGVLTRVQQEPRDPYSLVVELCTFSGAATGDEAGFAASSFQPGIDPIDMGMQYTMTVATGSPGGDLVDIWANSGSGGTCDNLETIQGPTDSAFGLETQIVGPAAELMLYVAAFGTSGDPGSSDGSLWSYSLNVSASDVDATFVDVLDGNQIVGLWPAVYTEVCDVLSGDDCQLVVGRPARSPPVVSVHDTLAGAITTDGTCQLPATSFGTCVASAGDVDEGGATDIAACGADSVLIVSGEAVRDNPGATVTTSAAILRTLTSPKTGTGFPSGVLGNLDVDGDGDLDIGVGAPTWSTADKSLSGAVLFFDAATGTLHTTIEGKISGDSLGSGPNPIIPLGDLGAPDGKLELAFPAPGHRTDVQPAGDILLQGSRVYLPLILKKAVPEPEPSILPSHEK